MAAVIVSRHSYQTTVVWAVLLGGASLAGAQSVGLPAPRLLTTTPMGGQARTLAAAQELPLNSVCNGTVADRSVDFYTFRARQGQRVVVDCATRGIDSKL